MSAAAMMRGLRELALALVDDPKVPARETMDDARFGELVDSIRALGLLQPLIVKPVGDRFEVVAGHRRRLACVAAGLERVPCVVVPDDPRSTEAIKLHENTKREDLNPAEEAVWFASMLETQAGGDVDTLAALVSESRQYVDIRLALVKNDPDVFQALKSGAINLSVANELNRVADVGTRRAYLDAAIRGGATARLVREWRLAHERLIGARAADDGSAGAHVGGVEQPPDSMLTCLFCSSSADPHVMVLVYMHQHCLQIFERTCGLELRGVFAPRPKAATSTPGEPSS